MITVKSPVMREYFINVLESYQGDVEFKHVETKGIDIIFKCTPYDDKTASLAKKVIKDSPQGQGLYFSVADYKG